MPAWNGYGIPKVWEIGMLTETVSDKDGNWRVASVVCQIIF